MRKEQNSKHFIFHYDEELQPVVDIVLQMSNYQKIMDFFGLKEFRTVTVNLFKDQNEFFDFLRKFIGEDATFPSYCKGTFDGDMANIYHSPSENPMGSGCSIFHELVHIVYRELYYKTNKNRVLWFDEGLAQAISGQASFDSKERLANYVKSYILPHSIPKLSDLSEHGDGFENKNYSGYRISYLCVRYLIDTCSKEQMAEYLKNPELIKNIDNDLPQKAAEYYVPQMAAIQ